MDNINCSEIIIKYISKDTTIKKFKYYNAFRNKWKRILLQYAKHNIHYFPSKVSNNDQIYKFQIPFSEEIFEINFNIPYLKYFIDKSTNFAKKIQLTYKDNKLYYYNTECIFSKYSESDCLDTYDDYDKIIACPFPLSPHCFIIVDGNHRVSHLINNGEYKINVNLLGQKIAHRAITSAFETAVYCCLFDCEIIKENIDKTSASIIKENLFVFDENSVINNFENRGCKFNQ